VVHLADQRERPVRQLVRDPDLPQRAVALQRRGQDVVDDRADVVARGAQQVARGIEVRIVDPDRVVEPERRASGGIAARVRAARRRARRAR
jgi:hypothetical protein